MRIAIGANSTPWHKKTSGGSVIVEAALIFLVFLVLLLGTFDFGQFLFIHQALVERARYAARWGAINGPTDAASMTNMVLYNQAAAPSSGTPSYFNLSAGNVSSQVSSAGTDDYRLNLKISGYKYIVLSPLIAGSYTGPQVNVSVPLGLYN